MITVFAHMEEKIRQNEAQENSFMIWIKLIMENKFATKKEIFLIKF